MMATLKNLKPSILEMPHDEAFALIKQVRFERRQQPVKKTAKRKTAKKSVDVKSLVNGMTPEMREALIKQLEG